MRPCLGHRVLETLRNLRGRCLVCPSLNVSHVLNPFPLPHGMPISIHLHLLGQPMDR